MSVATGLPRHVGDTRGRFNAQNLHRPVATSADLATGLSQGATDNMLASPADGSVWRFNATSTLTEDGILVIGSEPAGRWLRAAGTLQMLTSDPVIPGTTAPGAAIITLPAGCIIKPVAAWWNVTADFTGGTSSAIGADSDNASLNVAGDLLGDAAGDVAAGLTIGEARGTLGARIQEPTAILEPTNVVRYQEIVSQFTAGTATLRLLAYIIQNAGA